MPERIHAQVHTHMCACKCSSSGGGGGGAHPHLVGVRAAALLQERARKRVLVLQEGWLLRRAAGLSLPMRLQRDLRAA